MMLRSLAAWGKRLALSSAAVAQGEQAVAAWMSIAFQSNWNVSRHLTHITDAQWTGSSDGLDSFIDTLCWGLGIYSDTIV